MVVRHGETDRKRMARQETARHGERGRYTKNRGVRQGEIAFQIQGMVTAVLLKACFMT